MSAREWKPGDVALIDSWRGKGQIAFRTRRSLIEAWCVLDGHDTRGLDDHEIDEARPVVVLDPESDDVERLAEIFCSAYPNEGWVHMMRAALREFADPKPRIEEPTGLGAVVRDAEGSMLVRTPGVADRPAHWADMSGSFYTWADLDVAEILHEGWSE